MIDHNRYPIDHHLVRSLDSYRRTVILAGLSLPTRNSMAYWATRDPQNIGVFVSPKAMHRTIIDSMDRFMKVNDKRPPLSVVSPQWLYRNHPKPTTRIAIEVSEMGTNMLQFVTRIAATESMVAMRLLSPNSALSYLPYFRTLGFTVISYEAQFDPEDLIVRVIP